ncbi:hypothetical protein J437_LFUL017268 [Ladona fulva]|uniref:Radial spoke head 1 homolog n=1 Tax=Ladona fulva TaxID=123851 RepID=A0A8K0KPJ1_LADFU|nr:hypothetical protein J437_LFUL017268 [Ladona fulva]
MDTTLLGEEEKLGEEVDNKIGIYEGERNVAGERHGSGKTILPNKDIYEGMYKRGLREGKGLYIFRNGARYHGEWHKSQKDGHGTFYYPNGSKYEGEWQVDMRHGHGTYTYPNGDIYEGTWNKNLRHGLGNYYYKEYETHFIGAVGPGCFVFDTPTECMIHGEYILEKESSNESPGDFDPGEENGDHRQNVAQEVTTIWRSYEITPFDPNLLPPTPSSITIPDLRILENDDEELTGEQPVERQVDDENTAEGTEENFERNLLDEIEEANETETQNISDDLEELKLETQNVEQIQSEGANTNTDDQGETSQTEEITDSLEGGGSPIRNNVDFQDFEISDTTEADVSENLNSTADRGSESDEVTTLDTPRDLEELN